VRHDVVVLGGGPAALAAAAACAQAGLSVARVDPEPDAAWRNTYAAWEHDLDGLGLVGTLAHRYPGVTVVGDVEHRLGDPYAVFENEALAAALEAGAAGSELIVGKVVGANHDRWRSTAVLRDGRFLDATVIVDASGHWPVLVHRPERQARAAQTAFGLVARCRDVPYAPGSCVLMDWSPAGSAGEKSAPTFLYALDLGEGWWLLEETALAAQPPVGSDELRTHLHRRLDALGVVVDEVRATEEVAIPLGFPLPDRRQRAVGFGAAAGLVHPATGYSVGASLRLAPALALALTQALERRATPEGASAAAWSAVWPRWRVRARALESYGLDAVLRLDGPEVRAFFDAFFTSEDWRGYLRGVLDPADVGRLMRRVFAASPPAVRAALASGNPLPLVRALV
jgi:lycopene cyclase-like protein